MGLVGRLSGIGLAGLTAFVAVLGALVAGGTPVGAAPAGQESTATTIAYQPFEHGYMLWRDDVDKIMVVYTDIRTKLDLPCSEVYQDTFSGQDYALPPAPPGLTVPTLGFGWLYNNDPELARRLGYATADERSLLAQVRTENSGAGQATLVTPSDSVPGVDGVLAMANPDESGLSYCFPRRNENRGGLNTWVSRQLFEHGAMVWRQDMFDRIEVWHNDTTWEPPVACGDTLEDTWRPSMQLDFGALAVPGQRLPQRGFGKVWLENAYIRQSLGYPTSDELGGFAEISYEPSQSTSRGNIVLRHMTVHLSDGQDWTTTISIPNATGPESDRTLSMSCRSVIVRT